MNNENLKISFERFKGENPKNDAIHDFQIPSDDFLKDQKDKIQDQKDKVKELEEKI